MICTKCNEEKFDNFHKCQRHCKSCVAKADAAYYAKQRALVDEYKLRHGCIDCGFNTYPEALHFDHKDPMMKNFSIGRSIRKHWDKLLKEIEKCDVRCANCHAVKHKRLRMAVEMVAESVC